MSGEENGSPGLWPSASRADRLMIFERRILAHIGVCRTQMDTTHYLISCDSTTNTRPDPIVYGLFCTGVDPSSGRPLWGRRGRPLCPHPADRLGYRSTYPARLTYSGRKPAITSPPPNPIHLPRPGVAVFSMPQPTLLYMGVMAGTTLSWSGNH